MRHRFRSCAIFHEELPTVTPNRERDWDSRAGEQRTAVYALGCTRHRGDTASLLLPSFLLLVLVTAKREKLFIKRDVVYTALFLGICISTTCWVFPPRISTLSYPVHSTDTHPSRGPVCNALHSSGSSLVSMNRFNAPLFLLWLSLSLSLSFGAPGRVSLR